MVLVLATPLQAAPRADPPRDTTSAGPGYVPALIPGAGSINGIACPGAGRCVAVGLGAPGLAVVSNNWGRTWRRVSTLRTVFGLAAVSCPSLSDCVAVGMSTNNGAVALYSRDGGLKWRLGGLPRDMYRLETVACADATECVASGTVGNAELPLILRTVDAGARWTAASGGARCLEFAGLTCPTVRECIGVGNGDGAGLVDRSLDGDELWTTTQLGREFPTLLQVSCTTAKWCVTVGQYQSLTYPFLRGGIGVTTDSGETWTFRRGPLASSIVLRAVTCQRDLCVAVGDNNSVLQVAKSTDGGRIWKRLAPTLKGNFVGLSISFSRDSEYLVGGTLNAGRKGFILRSTSGA